MGQKKLHRFAEIKTFTNVFEYPENMKGNWHRHFGNNHPIVLELACGKGEYSIGLGKMDPSKNYIGVDVKGNRIWVGAKTALKEGLSNVAFMRTQIQKLAEYFAPGEVDEIWITFPDPQLRAGKAKKRLTHPRYLRLYQQVIKATGVIHLKTDSPDLYKFTKRIVGMAGLSMLRDVDDVYASAEVEPSLTIKTHYEKLDIAQSNRIHYLQFKVDTEISESIDELLKKEANEQDAG